MDMQIGSHLLIHFTHEKTCETHQVSVENLPDVKGYATSDAFIQHPTIQGLYKMCVGHIYYTLTSILEHRTQYRKNR